MAVKPIPDGYHSITPYLVVNGAPQVIAFLKEAFGAEEIMRMPGPNGTIGHAEVKIGDSIVMMADAGGPYPARPGNLLLYVPTVDEHHAESETHISRKTRVPTPQNS